jgi:hypothetical protein
VRTQCVGSRAAGGNTSRDVGLEDFVCADTCYICWTTNLCAESANETSLLAYISLCEVVRNGRALTAQAGRAVCCGKAAQLNPKSQVRHINRKGKIMFMINPEGARVSELMLL